MALKSFAPDLLVVAFALLSASCAAAQPLSQAPAQAVDGVYQGTTSRLRGAQVDGCSADGPIWIRVAGARFQVPWRPLQTFDAKIDQHGAFSATTATRVAAADKNMTIVPALQGKVVDGRISGEYGTRWCSYRFEAVKQ